MTTRLVQQLLDISMHSDSEAVSVRADDLLDELDTVEDREQWENEVEDFVRFADRVAS